VSEVADALAALREGRLSLAEVEQMFAARDWPAAPVLPPGTLADEAFPPAPEGSFTEVSVAYSAGLIDSEQYAALAKAAARQD
jgi:hypothetical protein